MVVFYREIYIKKKNSTIKISAIPPNMVCRLLYSVINTTNWSPIPNSKECDTSDTYVCACVCTVRVCPYVSALHAHVLETNSNSEMIRKT